jgi:hypothetical protein
MSNLSPHTYLKLLDTLLERHFGIDVNCTAIHEENVQQLIDAQRPAYQVVNEFAQEDDLVRIDVLGFYGVPKFAPITEEDERAVLHELMPIEAEREKFEEKVYRDYFLSNVTNGLTLNAGVASKDELLKRKGDDYADERVSAMWYAWKVALESRDIAPGEDLLYVIQSESEFVSQEGAGFWSNEMGWGNFNDATLFTAHEVPGLDLPSLGVGDARWMTLAEARTLDASMRAARRPGISM